MPSQRHPLLEDLLALRDEAARNVLLKQRADEIDDELIDTLAHWGMEAHERGDGAAALSFPMLGIQAAQAAGDAYGEAKLLLIMGRLSARDGQPVMARELLESGYRRASGALTSLDHDLVAVLYSLGVELMNLGLQEGRLPEARTLLEDARSRFNAVDASAAELGTTCNLASICAELGKMAQARDYGRLIAPLYRRVSAQPPEGLPAPQRETVCRVIDSVASVLMRAGGDPEGAVDLLEQLVSLDPGYEDARFRLGGAQMQAGRWDEALDTWRAVVEETPDRAAAQANYAQALLAKGDVEKGLEALAAAIELGIDDDRLFILRGQTHQRLEQHALAVDDFTRVIEPASSDPDLERQARHGRALSLQHLERTEEALEDAEAIRSSKEEESLFLASLLEGDIHRLAADPQRALERYDDALRIVPEVAFVHLRRADVLIESGRADEALADLRFAGRRDREPAEARQRLEAILEENPSHVGARKLRAYCLLQEVQPEAAAAELTSVLERTPDDAQAHHWRGLARLTSNDEPDDAAWNSGLDWDRITDALTDLTRAHALDPADAEFKHAYVWLADRGLGHPVLSLSLRDRADEDDGIFTLVPPIRVAYGHYDRSFVLADKRRWSDAVASLLAAQHHFEAAGFHLMAKRMHLHLADNRLRLWELQEALDDLDAFGEILGMHAMPLSPYLVERAEQIRRRGLSRSGRETVTMELEYRHVYGILATLERDYLHLMRAQALSRLRRHSEAVAALDGVADALDDPEGAIRRGLAIRALAGAAQVYRDAGEHTRALKLAQALESLTEKYGDRDTVLSLIGTLHEVLGETEQAQAYFGQVAEALGDDTTGARTSNALQRAGNQIQADRLDEAIATLDAIDIEKEARSLWDRYIYYFHRGQALLRSGRFDESLEAIESARDIAEHARSTLHRYESRISWQASQEDLYSLAVSAAIGTGQASKALSLVEQAQARTFVDQLAHGTLPLPGEARHLEDVQANVNRTRELLVQLLHSVARNGPDYLDLGLLEALESVDPSVEVLDGADDGGRTISLSRVESAIATTERTAARLAEEVEQARLAGAVSVEGEVLSVEELGEILTTATEEEGLRVVLAEFFVTRWSTFLFVLEPGNEPSAYLVERGAGELEARLASLPAGGAGRPGFLRAEIRELLTALTTPLAGHLRDGDLLWIVPHHVLHLLPLHLAEVEGRPLIETHPVCHTPSASVMRYCRRRRREHSGRTVVVGDPRGDLPYARLEALEVGDLFEVRPLLAEEATPGGVLQALDEGPADILHLACHGYFDEEDALRSGILLAPPEKADRLGDPGILSAEQLGELQLELGLVTLSACETGRARRRGGDELVGLSRAVFRAGAAALLVSQWEVDDLATSLLLRKFYELRGDPRDDLGGGRTCRSLQSAQIYVRDITAGELVEYCEARQEAMEPGQVHERWLRFQMAKADAQLMAGDLPSGLASCDTLLERAERLGGPVGDHLSRRAREALSLIRLQMEFDPEPVSDYARRPFADPYFWGAFVLVGDWN